MNYGIEFENEYYIGKNNIHLDIYIKSLNVVIEIYGDFWHANPKKYKESDELNMPDGHICLVKEIWEKDKGRVRIINEILSPRKIFIFWEYDICHNLNQIKDKLKKFFDQFKN